MFNLKGLLQRRQSARNGGDITRIAHHIERRIDRTAMDVFAEFKEVFLLAPPSYVVAAVWGVQAGGEITPTQRRIHNQVLPSIEDSMEPLLSDTQDPAQRFAIDFMLRGLVITKIIYMIEVARKQIGIDEAEDFAHEPHPLEALEPMGTA